MNRLILALCVAVLALVAVGCESVPKPFQEFYYLDKEWGQAQQKTWDSQIIHKESPYAQSKPEGMDGLDAEEVMRVLHKTYGEGPSDTEIFEMGVTQ